MYVCMYVSKIVYVRFLTWGFERILFPPGIGPSQNGHKFLGKRCPFGYGRLYCPIGPAKRKKKHIKFRSTFLESGEWQPQGFQPPKNQSFHVLRVQQLRPRCVAGALSARGIKKGPSLNDQPRLTTQEALAWPLRHRNRFQGMMTHAQGGNPNSMTSSSGGGGTNFRDRPTE